MKHVFYFLAIFALIYEMKGLFYPDQQLKKINKRAERNKKQKPLSSEDKAWTWATVFYMAWLIVGLFTFQWWLFLVLFLIGFIPKKWAWYVWLDSVISVGIILFIVLNAFHFKITFNQLINYF